MDFKQLSLQLDKKHAPSISKPQVLLSRIALVVIDHDGVHGPNMMRDLGSGLQLKVSRPLGVALQRGGQIVATPASSAAQLEQAPALPPMQVRHDFVEGDLPISFHAIRKPQLNILKAREHSVLMGYPR